MFNKDKKEMEDFKKANHFPGTTEKQISIIAEKETTVDGIVFGEPGYKKQAEERKKMTLDEQRENTRKKRKVTGKTTLVYRNVKSNPDLVFLGLIVLSCLALGFCIAKAVYGVTAKDVIDYIWDFAQIVVTLAGAIAFVVAKIYTKPGPIAESFQSNGNKENTDKYGRTIIQ